MYLIVKYLHIISAAVSILGFIFRAVLAFRLSPLLQHKISKVLPHINDTILFIAGVSLMVMSGQYPWHSYWLAAKLGLLLAYIGFGATCLKSQRQTLRAITFIAALGCFIGIVCLARFRPF